MKKIFALFIVCAVLLVTYIAIPSDNKKEISDNDDNPAGFSLNNVQLSAPSDSNIDETSNHTEYQVLNRSYDEFSQNSTNIVLAKYVESTKYETENGIEQIEYVFSVIKQLKGTITEDKIFVRAENSYITPYVSIENFLDGSEQILLLEKVSSVYLPHDHYILTGNSFYDGSNIELIAEELTAVDLNTYDTTESLFTRDDDMNEVMEFSQNIFEVEVRRAETIFPDTPKVLYNCTVKKVIQGYASSSEILIRFFSNTVEEGKRYIVLLQNNKDDTSILYLLSSPESSVYTPEEAEQISQISSIMESRSGGNIPPAPKTDAEILAGEQEYYFGKAS